MISSQQISTQYEQALIKKHKSFLNKFSPSPELMGLNESGLKRFRALKFPHKTHEMYSYVDLKELAAADTSFEVDWHGEVNLNFVKSNIYPSCKNSVLIFVDGVYQENLSELSGLNSFVVVEKLETSLGRGYLKNHLFKSMEQENDVFSAINGAFLREGLVIKIKPHSRFLTPLQILHLSTGSEHHFITRNPRIFIEAGKFAEFKLLVKYAGTGGNYFVNSVQDLMVREGAQVDFSQIQADHPSAFHFSKNRIQLEQDSRFFAANASGGSKLTRHHFEVHLKGKGAELNLNGLSILEEKEQVHNYVRIFHEAPNCSSCQLFKNILNGKSRSSIDGTVVVQPGASATYSNQLINNLMLSDEAQAGNKPNLMISTDDVQCTHGATVGQIDEEQLFYLNSRGFSPHEAKSLLAKGFAKSVIDTIKFPEAVTELEETLLKKLENF